MSAHPRLLVASLSCVEPVNRAVYRELATRHGVDLHLLIPAHHRDGNVNKGPCKPTDGEPFPCTLLEPTGTHQRLYRLSGFEHLIATTRPTHVLVDTDPGSMLTTQARVGARQVGAKLWSVTCENLPRSYLAEACAGALRLKPGAAVGGCIAWWLWRTNGPAVDRLFTISQDGSRVMTDLGFGGRITQIPLGFDPGLFDAQPPERVRRTRDRLGLKHRTIAYFGRLVPEKGVDRLIEALSRLRDLPWQFLIDQFETYRTPYVEELNRAIDNSGIRDRTVNFDAKHDEMPDYMNAADIVVLPSVSTPKWVEQYGRVVPEAMACGRVVVGSAVGAIPELIGDAGHLTPEGDVEALAECLRRLLGEKQEVLSAVGQRAHTRAHAKLSLSAQAEIWAGLLRADLIA
jgi:hypothetical protein